MDDAADTIENLRNRLTETCHDVGLAPYFFECSECGKTHLRNAAYVDMPNYCPECGRKVVG
jgi:rubrerythrin